jgi:hypothetical protein
MNNTRLKKKREDAKIVPTADQVAQQQELITTVLNLSNSMRLFSNSFQNNGFRISIGPVLYFGFILAKDPKCVLFVDKEPELFVGILTPTVMFSLSVIFILSHPQILLL